MRRSLAAILFLLIPAPGLAGEHVDLLGEWTVRPYTWRNSGCRYHQWVSVERRIGPNRYAGIARSRHDCFGLHGGIQETPVELSIEGTRVTITSDRPTWLTETLQYHSPTRMDGQDTIGHEFIYERSGRPGV